MGFEIHSEQEATVEIQLEERVSKGFPVEGIGSHPEYNSERWTTYPDGRLVFQSRLEPKTTLVTVYGVRIDDEKRGAFMDDPKLTVSEVDGTDERTDGKTPIVADGPGEIAAVPVTSVTGADAGSAMTDEAEASRRRWRPNSVPVPFRGRIERHSARRSGQSNPRASASRSITSNRA